uniref:Glycerol-3-phosphate acyltransferase RAM2/GPAT1-8 HAD-like domain-containing protein n=1 Tax=Aegilops tauschii TaxID=37682 RepID=M8ATY5_AEGTA
MANNWVINLYRAARKLGSNQVNKPSTAAASRCTIPSVGDRTVVCDFDGRLLRSTALFPYFMLMACEGGSLIRALLLLCCFPLVWVMGEHSDASVQVMAFVTFVGLRPRDTDLVARAVLPKFYMEGLNALVYNQLWLPARRKVAVTSAPRPGPGMRQKALREVLGADGAMADVAVVGTSNPLNRLFIPYCKHIEGACSFGVKHIRDPQLLI